MRGLKNVEVCPSDTVDVMIKVGSPKNATRKTAKILEKTRNSLRQAIFCCFFRVPRRLSPSN